MNEGESSDVWRLWPNGLSDTAPRLLWSYPLLFVPVAAERAPVWCLSYAGERNMETCPPCGVAGSERMKECIKVDCMGVAEEGSELCPFHERECRERTVELLMEIAIWFEEWLNFR